MSQKCMHVSRIMEVKINIYNFERPSRTDGREGGLNGRKRYSPVNAFVVGGGG